MSATSNNKGTSLWRTAEAIQEAAPPAEITGRSDLMEYFQLSNVAPVAAKSLHVDYSNPDHVRQFDFISKLQGPPQCKQFYRQPAPVCHWDLLPIADWPTNRPAYNFHAYPMDSIQRSFQLQPGACSLPEVDLGELVGPDRVQLALGAQTAAPAGKAGWLGQGQGTRGSEQPVAAADLGRGKRTQARRRMAALAGESLATASVASGDTGDTTTHDISSRKRQRANDT